MPSADFAEVHWPLAGRDSELATLRAALARRPARSVLLTGPAGAGKTRLAREAQALAAEAGLAGVWLTASHSLARTPLGVFAPLLPVVDREPAGTIQDLLARSARALTRRARGHGLVLFVDDAHLLDDTSAGLLLQLVGNHAVSVVLTVRSGEPVPEPVSALWRDELASRLEIAQLDHPAVGAVLAAALGDQVDPATVAELAGRSGGNALFLRELTLGALRDRTLIRDVGVWRLTAALSPSERVVELVQARLRGLDTSAIEMLELASYGEPLGSAELDELGDPEVLDLLLRQQLLVSSFDGRRLQVRLAHPLYGEVVRATTSAVRTAKLGRRLAGVVERTGARRRGDTLRLGNWRLDGGGGKPDLMLRAARDARWHYDFVLAEKLAKAAAATGGGFDARLLAAQAQALQGRPEEAERELARLTPEAHDDDARVRLTVAHVDCLWFYLGRMTEALRVAEQGEASISNPRLREQVAARRAGVLLGSHGPRAAAEVAIPLMATAQGPSLVWLGLVGSYGLGRLGRIEESLLAADRGWSASVGLSEPDDWYPWFTLYARCEALAHAGRFAEARELAEQEYQHGLDEGSSEARAWFLWNLCRTARDTGDLMSGARRAREAIILLRRLGRRSFQHSLFCLLAQSLAMTGDVPGAREALRQADELGVEPPAWSVVDYRSAHGWIAVAEGHLADGRACFELAAADGVQVGDLTGSCAALHDIARTGAPRIVAERLTALAAEVEGELAAERTAHVEALMAKDARRLLDSAVRFGSMGAHLLAAESAADAAVAYRAAGNINRAKAAQHVSARWLANCESPATVALASVDLRTQLTAAERETALLAAQGWSSKAIADHLQLSPRTIDNRLARVFHKLGVSKRSELSELVE